MTDVWTLAALWLALALIATLFAIWFRVSTALTEIIVGTIAQFVLVGLVGTDVLGTNEPWVKFLAGLGAIVLTFLAGAELDPVVFRRNWKEATAVGLIGFFAPFFGCAAAAYWILDWGPQQSWLAGVALSTTSVAVVYAVMLEYGFADDAVMVFEDFLDAKRVLGVLGRRFARYGLSLHPITARSYWLPASSTISAPCLRWASSLRRLRSRRSSLRP
jgi:Kef-type K+ transport system membrane component KefB